MRVAEPPCYLLTASMPFLQSTPDNFSAVVLQAYRERVPASTQSAIELIQELEDADRVLQIRTVDHGNITILQIVQVPSRRPPVVSLE